MAEQQQALDSLYKVVRFWKSNEILNQYFPLQNWTSELEMEYGDISCDIWEFEKNIDSEEINQMEAAVELYKGSLLFEEYYEWIEDYGAYYEMRIVKLMDFLIAHFEKKGNKVSERYYQKKRNLYFSEKNLNEF